ncbi:MULTISPECIES: hypothetical protein [unclassified Leucobacter]|uniref:hypothetical protein n=1 Tax=unclassified Leucobacter TaxID=2621730 RepID=UPI00165DD36D|nr:MULTISPECIES: hypothetical protein [unclassified Leucobacter]MBC9926447.1 hypothetical protein [Leucobacter sp. cx-169]
MTNEPSLLLLHGVGAGDVNDDWRDSLSTALVSLGYPELTETRVIVPKYAHALLGSDDKTALPEITVKQPPRAQARQNRRDFERRIGAIEFRLGRHNHGSARIGGDTTIDLAVKLPQFAQARNYMQKPQIRAQVLSRILSTLPESGQVVIVAHSLGSVIAADLVRRLPSGLKVSGMVTIGSPLANGNFNPGNLRDILKEPPTNLAWWVNFWNSHDPVAAHRGVSSVFPWVIDFCTQSKLSPRVHDAVEYLADESVASAIGFALFGSRSKEIARAEKSLDIPVDYAERIVLWALRYAHLIQLRLEGDLRDRYAGALRHVQAAAVGGVRQRNLDENRGLPFEIARLAFDLSDPDAFAPEPLPSSHMSKDEASLVLTLIASENIIRPFEISVPRDKREEALQDLTAEMGLGSLYGAEVFAAAKLAQEVASGKRGVDWVRWGIVGAGAVALVVATGGLALAAAPGLAGAAVVTSALASFGPGGMIGGLLTAGTLVTAGGGSIAYGLASADTSSGTLEEVVSRQLALVILRNGVDPAQDRAVWANFVEIETSLRRKHERLDEFSDESAPALKELVEKLGSIERALSFMREKGFEPGVEPADASEPKRNPLAALGIRR